MNGRDILGGDRIPLSELPARSSLHVLSAVTEEPSPLPALDCGSIRLSRTDDSLAIDCLVSYNNQLMWAHFYVMPTDSESGYLVFASLGSAMQLAYVLAATPPGSAGNRLLHQYAPRAAVLTDTGRTSVEGEEFAILNQHHADGLFTSFVTAVRDGPVGDHVDARLFNRSASVFPAAMRLCEETYDLTRAFESLPPQERQSMLTARSAVDWRRLLEKSAEVVGRLAEMADAADKFTSVFADP